MAPRLDTDSYPPIDLVTCDERMGRQDDECTGRDREHRQKCDKQMAIVFDALQDLKLSRAKGQGMLQFLTIVGLIAQLAVAWMVAHK